jgi:hypothetical protein
MPRENTLHIDERGIEAARRTIANRGDPEERFHGNEFVPLMYQALARSGVRVAELEIERRAPGAQFATEGNTP